MPTRFVVVVPRTATAPDGERRHAYTRVGFGVAGDERDHIRLQIDFGVAITRHAFVMAERNPDALGLPGHLQANRYLVCLQTRRDGEPRLDTGNPLGFLTRQSDRVLALRPNEGIALSGSLVCLPPPVRARAAGPVDDKPAAPLDPEPNNDSHEPD